MPGLAPANADNIITSGCFFGAGPGQAWEYLCNSNSIFGNGLGCTGKKKHVYILLAFVYFNRRWPRPDRISPGIISYNNYIFCRIFYRLPCSSSSSTDFYWFVERLFTVVFYDFWPNIYLKWPKIDPGVTPDRPRIDPEIRECATDKIDIFSRFLYFFHRFL